MRTARKIGKFLFVLCFQFCVPQKAKALDIQTTGCRFTSSLGDMHVESPFGSILEQMAAIDHAVQRGEKADIRSTVFAVAESMAALPSPNRAWTVLDLLHRLDRGGFDRTAVDAIYRRFMELLDPVARQSSEIHTGHLANYLQAHYYVYGANGEDRLRRLRALQLRLRQGPECFERRFFLLLRLAHEIGEYHGRTVVRPDLEALWADAAALRGIGREGSPMKWAGYSLLTTEAVRFRQFDLAERWLDETMREAEAVKATPGVSAVTVDIVDTLMMGLPSLVAQEKDAFGRARAAGLD
jgi:hypothetical protein